MTVKKKVAAPGKSNSNTILLKQDDGKSKDRQIAEIALSSATMNAMTARTFTMPSMGEIDISETIHVMYEKMGKVKAGDLSGLEAILTAQTVSLNSIFNEMARRAALNMGTHLQVTETYMRLAFKAQAQCARTIEVLAAMKTPPVVFAKQANISHGHQQVNNGTNPNNTQPPAHTEKTINQQNELLEVNNGSEKMDSGTAQTTIPKDKAMATVAT
ncbi:hypothetical protein GALL_256420 [mine drainage metagenome]|uniref:Uncharacterized protein n=1 Tax=mine drainage metagenome TaxID=410659 RepID=A0A1J5RWC1_9ZZZZ